MGLEKQSNFSGELVVHEETYLFEAPDVASAEQMAIQLGRQAESLDDGLTIDGEPARRFFAGVLRVVPTENLVGDANDRPINGCEIMYQEFTLNSRADLTALMNGKPVTIARSIDD